MKDKIKNICDFYAITHKLKNTLRTGWVACGIPTDRIESVAEHIYSCQMLALAIHSEFDLKLDMPRVALLLAIHELGECIVGDFPAYNCPVSKEEKSRLELDAVIKILSPLSNPTLIKNLFIESEKQETHESKFAHLIDKLECDFQCKYYEEQGHLDYGKLTPQDSQLERFAKYKSAQKPFHEMWITNDINKFFQNEPYNAIAKYIITNKIF